MGLIKEKMIEKWEDKVRKVAEETGYDFDDLWPIWTEELMEENGKSEEEKWDYFVCVSHEHDW